MNNNNNQTEAVCDSREMKSTAESTKSLSQWTCACVWREYRRTDTWQPVLTYGAREKESEKNSKMHLPNSFLSKFTKKKKIVETI